MNASATPIREDQNRCTANFCHAHKGLEGKGPGAVIVPKSVSASFALEC